MGYRHLYKPASIESSTSSNRKSRVTDWRQAIQRVRRFEDSDGDYDDDDLDPIARPEWNPGEVHILKLPETPFWGMAR